MEFDIEYQCEFCRKIHVNRFKQSKIFYFFLEPVNHNCNYAFNIYFDSRGKQMVDLRTRQWNIGFNSTDDFDDIANDPGTVYVRLATTSVDGRRGIAPEAIQALPDDLTNIVNKYV